MTGPLRSLAATLAAAAILAGQQPAPAQAPPAQQPAPAQPAPAQPAAPPTTAPAQPQASTFRLNIQGASLADVISLLAQNLRLNYILDPRVSAKGAVTINTYGELRQVDARQLLETVLRMNGAAMVQVGEIFRIVPINEVARLPLSPGVDVRNFPEDDRMVMNMVFLKYATAGELQKLLTPFIGEGAQMTVYDPANLLLILDSSRNMKRTMELIGMFDSDTLASQRVRLFEVENGRPSDLARDLEQVLKAISLSGDKNTPVRFLPIDRINTLVAIAPNPGVFEQVQTWLKKLDIPAKSTAGSRSSSVYRVKYGRAETLAMAIMQLYLGMMYPGFMGGYGGFGMGGMNQYVFPGGMGGMGMGGYGMGGYGMGGFGGMSPYGMGMGGMYGGMGGYGMGGYGMGAFGRGMPGMAGAYPQAGLGVPSPTGAGGTGGAGSSTSAGVSNLASSMGPAGDLTGSYMGASGYYGYLPPNIPRVIPNPFDNTLLLQATPDEYQDILRLLTQLDVPPRQVLVEARIYEVNMSGSFASGVQAFLRRRTSANRQLAASSGPVEALSGVPGLQLSAGLLVGASRELLGELVAAESSGRAKLVSAPALIATDSIPASINVGDEVPTLAGQAVSGIQQGGNSLFTQSLVNRQTGVTLNVMARVNPSGIVTLVIQQEVSAPVAPSEGAAIQAPSFSNRNVNTQVTVEDGDTIAIGGIISESNTYGSSGVPILHRIPVLGAAFGTKSISRQRTELVIFMTPRIIYDTSQISEASDELRSRFKKLNRMIPD